MPEVTVLRTEYDKSSLEAMVVVVSMTMYVIGTAAEPEVLNGAVTVLTVDMPVVMFKVASIDQLDDRVVLDGTYTVTTLVVFSDAVIKADVLTELADGPETVLIVDHATDSVEMGVEPLYRDAGAVETIEEGTLFTALVDSALATTVTVEIVSGAAFGVVWAAPTWVIVPAFE